MATQGELVRVIIESPLNAPTDVEVEENKVYARACCLDSLKKGEAPLASHLLYTQMLDDRIPEERILGIRAGLAWMPEAKKVAFYMDRGFSSGMQNAQTRALLVGLPVEIRYLGHR